LYYSDKLLGYFGDDVGWACTEEVLLDTGYAGKVAGEFELTVLLPISLQQTAGFSTEPECLRKLAGSFAIPNLPAATYI